MPMIYVENKFITVIGAGKSGIAAAKLLKHQKADILLYDANVSLNDNTALINELNSLQIDFLFGEVENKIYDSEFVVISPGIPSYSPFIQTIRSKRIPVVSEIEVAFWFAKAPVIGITGSNGKSTVTSLIDKFLNTSGLKSIACGNIGKAFSEAVLESIIQNEHPYYVVEISSFQLENISLFLPDTAIILNITPDHLNRYNSFNDYAETKMLLFKNQSILNYAVINSDDSTVNKLFFSKAKVLPFSLNNSSNQVTYFENNLFKFKISDSIYSLETDNILLPGKHNQQNIMAAVSAVSPYIKDPDGIIKVLSTFTGIEHRIENCGTKNEVSYYNDSKATNLDSVKVALDSFEGNIHLILGGQDKEGNFSSLNTRISEKVKTVYTIGSAMEKIKSQLNTSSLIESHTLDEAIKTIYKSAIPGDIVLLSPGCASFDQFSNFEERGNYFKSLVKALK